MVLVPPLAGVAAPVFGFEAGRSAHLWKWLDWSIIAALVSVGGGIVERVARKWNADRAIAVTTDALTQHRVELNGALEPVARGIGESAGRLLAGEAASEAAGLTAYGLVAAASKLTGPERGVRASYFALRRDGPVQLLEPTAWSTGRKGPATTFRSDNPSNYPAFHMFDTGLPIVCHDTEVDAPEGFAKRKDRAYRSFVSAPVIAHTTRLGMLTVDAPDPKVFSNEDVFFIEVLAELFGATMAMKSHG